MGREAGTYTPLVLVKEIMNTSQTNTLRYIDRQYFMRGRGGCGRREVNQFTVQDKDEGYFCLCK